MRIVADTNVIVSAFLWGGTPRRLLDAVEARRFELFTSRALVTDPELRDPDDALVLACALAARAEAIVSGDADLHALGSYQGIPVISPADCLKRIAT